MSAPVHEAAPPGLIFDAHTDVPIRLYEEPADLLEEVEGRHVDLPKLRRGGVGALVFALFVPPHLEPEEGLWLVERLHRLSLQQLQRGAWRAVRQVEEARQAAREGDVAVFFALENGRPLTVPGALERCREIGVRYVTLTHGASHEWCDSATGRPRHGGLSSPGVELVERLNAAGILADVSHVSEKAAHQAITASSLPVIASHSASAALCPHPGNLSNALARRIGESGGVLMVNSHPAMLDAAACRLNQERWQHIGPRLAELEASQQEDPKAYALGLERLFAEYPLPSVGLDAYAEHILHFVDVAGAGHVGIGSDFDGIPETLEGFENAGCFPALAASLQRRGLDSGTVRGILGENLLRVLNEVDRATAPLHSPTLSSA